MEYDLCIIGGGSAGTWAARIAAERGASVVLAEAYRMGGTCVIRGCVPKKLLVLAGRLGTATAEAMAWGWQAETAKFDWGSLVERVQREITRLESHYCANLRHAGVEIIQRQARLVDPHTVAFDGDERLVSAKTILIATGGHPMRPERHPGIGLTSNEIFTRSELPLRLVIAGAVYIAVEFAGVFAALGSQVTLICRGDGLLAGFDRDLGDALAACYRARGSTMMIS